MKIAIDLGHGVGPDRGAEGVVTEESIIHAVGSFVITKLQTLGHNVIAVRPTNASSVTDSLQQRCDAANNFGAERYVSIHANAGGGRGSEVYTYQGKEVDFARSILNNLVNLGFTNRGIKGEGLYVTHYTNMPACLVEVCFCDTQSDVELYNSIGVDKISDAIVRGIVGQTVAVNVNQQPVQTNTDNWVARLQSACNAQGFSNQVVDGIPGANTLNGCPLIRRGAIGNITKLLQEKLNSFGFNCGSVDGIFGIATDAAVIAFQTAHGLIADGVVGMNTWKVLLGL